MMRLIAIAIALAVTELPSAVLAQSQATIAIGVITSTQECTLYKGTAGQSSSYARGNSSGYTAGGGGGYINNSGAGASGHYMSGSASNYAEGSSSSWSDFFVKECIGHFDGIRTAMQAALASSGKVAVGPSGYMVTGRINTVAAIGNAVAERGGSAMSASLKVSAEIVVHDSAGHIVYGAPLSVKIDTETATVSGGYRTANAMAGDGVYGLLQQQIAMAMARKVALHFVPLIVLENTGRSIRLNYGDPLLERGMVVRARGNDGSDVRFQISSVSDGTALATLYSDGDPSRIIAGAPAELADPGEARWDRVELP